ncbi:hypothetical protein SEA_RASPUTIA_15 [Microbacterium phage Rasputia]|nr:hypothetical protein SEA_RASPUTIA_15 [Microbacterium phage Rasputia]
MIPFLMTKSKGLWWAFPMTLTKDEHAEDCDGINCRGVMRPESLPIAWAFTENGLRKKVVKTMRALAREAQRRERHDAQKAASESLGG